MPKKQIIDLREPHLTCNDKGQLLNADLWRCSLPIASHLSYFQQLSLGLTIGLVKSTQLNNASGCMEDNEAFIVLEGQARLKNTLTGEINEISAGQGFILPQGMQYQWQQKKDFSALHLVLNKKRLNLSELNPSDFNKEQADQPVGIIRFETEPEQQDLLNVELGGDSFVMKTEKPVNKGEHLYQSQQDNQSTFIAGTWQSDALETQSQKFPRHEFIYIKSGSLVCIDEENQPYTFNAGDALFIPKGTICRWLITEAVSSYYVIIQ